MTLLDIQKRVAAQHGLSVKDLIDPKVRRRQRKDVIRARDEAIFECWSKLAHYTLARLGNEFGRMHHTSVLFAIRREGDRRAA